MVKTGRSLRRRDPLHPLRCALLMIFFSSLKNFYSIDGSVSKLDRVNIFKDSFEKCNTKTQRYGDTKSEDEISHQIIGASIEVHRTLDGPGLLESIYEAALWHELILRGLHVHRQRPVQVVYKGAAIKEPLFIDVVVEDKVLVEVKAIEKNHPIYETQVLTYLRLTGIKLGLLVNFGAPYVKDGVSRIINGSL